MTSTNLITTALDAAKHACVNVRWHDGPDIKREYLTGSNICASIRFMSQGSHAASIATIRRFNRFHIRLLGLLNEKLLNSDYTLTEARVLYELAQADGPVTPTQLTDALVLDAGYLSRILKRFEKRGLLRKTPSRQDGRQTELTLTASGQAAFAPLDAASEAEIGAMVAPLSATERADLVTAMATIERVLSDTNPAPVAFRDLQPGDLGWIVRRQTLLYADEYGWDGSFEASAAEILAGFTKTYDRAKEKAWIAVRGDRIVGSVFVMRGSDDVAKLRMLYVEPEARGLGLGHELVRQCIEFARSAGYATLTLWTNDVLAPARHIYQSAGFVCVKREPHSSFGQNLVGETWNLALR